jgi:diguanylate cyclase (GGDEF)-like protein
MARKGTGRREGSGRTILLVDDSLEILESSRALLEREGHTVLVADNGPDALAILRREDVELLLVDYFMPGMTGEDVVRELRTFNTRVQVILQTGYASERPPREMLAKLDIQGYCDKSEGPEELLLWTDVGLKFAKQVRTLDMSRQGLRYILDVTPDLHRIQPLEELLQGILYQIAGLVGAVHSFVAVQSGEKRKDPEGSNAFLAMVEEERELVIHAGIGRFEGEESVERAVPSAGLDRVRESLKDGLVHRESGTTCVPLRIGALTIGVIYLDEVPDILPENVEMLNVFANQAAVAVQNAQLYQMATLDPLTGVYARKFWEQMALREIRTAFRFRHPLTIAIFDLDHFKSINDLHGHLTGDKALETVGRVLRGSSRSSDVVGRFGGDEFVAVLPRTSQEGATVFCNRVLRELERQAMHGTMGPYDLRTSIGLSTLLPHAFEMNSLPRPIPNPYFQQVLRSAFSRADRKVYASKRTGGHTFNFDDACDWPDPRDWNSGSSSPEEITSTFLPSEET